MSKQTVITSDSTCDLPAELLERYSIHIIPLTITLGEESFLDGEQFTPADMYRRYREDGTLPKTSAPGYQQYLDFFTQFTSAGCEVVHLTISSELSASYNNACLAAETLQGVHVVDSRMLSNGVGLLALEGAEAVEGGRSAEEIAGHLNALTGKVQTSFVLNTLEYMRKGGRCSGITAFGANLLKIKPALMMKDGKLQVYKKYRGGIAGVYRQYAEDRLAGRRIHGKHVFLVESGEIAPETLDELETLIRERLPGCETHRAVAGCTISSHCGPQTLGVMFIEE